MDGSGYKNLIVWQKAKKVAVEIYKLTENFPKSEVYGLTNQMRRSAVSIPSNIAKGSKRGSKKEFRQFLIIAYGSGAELESKIEIAKELPFAEEQDCTKIDFLLSEVMRMLNKMIKY